MEETHAEDPLRQQKLPANIVTIKYKSPVTDPTHKWCEKKLNVKNLFNFTFKTHGLNQSFLSEVHFW